MLWQGLLWSLCTQWARFTKHFEKNTFFEVDFASYSKEGKIFSNDKILLKSLVKRAQYRQSIMYFFYFLFYSINFIIEQSNFEIFCRLNYRSKEKKKGKSKSDSHTIFRFWFLEYWNLLQQNWTALLAYWKRVGLDCVTKTFNLKYKQATNLKVTPHMLEWIIENLSNLDKYREKRLIYFNIIILDWIKKFELF